MLEALRGDARPKLFLGADSDPVLPLEVGRRFAAVLAELPVDYGIECSL